VFGAALFNESVPIGFDVFAVPFEDMTMMNEVPPSHTMMTDDA